MTTTLTTTSADSVSELLGSLYANEVTVTPDDSDSPIDGPRVVATYIDNEGTVCDAIVCDLSVANSLGAALTMIPPGGVDDAIAAGEVPENIAANLYEVLNIAASLFVRSESKRIVLDAVLLPGQVPSDTVRELIESARESIPYCVAISRYPAGRVHLLSH